VQSVVKKNSFLKILKKSLRIILVCFGAFFLFFIILGFTSAPFHIWYNHSLLRAGIHRPPDYIVILGGGGMPSESGLIRSWYAAKTASHFSKALVIISLPGDTTDSRSSVNQMKNELIIRGIDQSRIILEAEGTNTRSQALNIRKLVEKIKIFTNYELRITNKSSIVNCKSSILIVTSPEHLTRAVLTFKKAGFLKVDGVPSFEAAIESDITFNDRMLGGREWIPGVGGNLSIRYHFWTQLRYEELIIREFLAIFYYQLKGWI
jgi:uncharacterized SAM-binding protein YcdF (DUF218 family)